MAALDIFMHLIKCKLSSLIYRNNLELTCIDEQNQQLVKLYKDKMTQFMSRAEYIKK